MFQILDWQKPSVYGWYTRSSHVSRIWLTGFLCQGNDFRIQMDTSKKRREQWDAIDTDTSHHGRLKRWKPLHGKTIARKRGTRDTSPCVIFQWNVWSSQSHSDVIISSYSNVSCIVTLDMMIIIRWIEEYVPETLFVVLYYPQVISHSFKVKRSQS